MVGGKGLIKNGCEGPTCEIIPHAQEPSHEEYVQKLEEISGSSIVI